MTTLKELVNENNKMTSSSMNNHLKHFANENEIDLFVGHNNRWGMLPHEEIIEGTEVTEEFIRTLQLLGTRMEPSLEALNTSFNKLSEIEQRTFSSPVQLISDDKTYKGLVTLETLSKLHTFWINMNELKEI